MRNPSRKNKRSPPQTPPQDKGGNGKHHRGMMRKQDEPILEN